MDLILHMRSFVRVAELGSFSAAARALQASQPAISRQVADLERRLGARLLHRSASGVALTEEGGAFLEAARQALAATDAAMALPAARRGEVSGRVRLGAPVAFGRLHVVPRLPALMAQHPGLAIDLVMADAPADLVQDGLDASIRIGVITDGELVRRPLGTTSRAVLAAPGYLARAGVPLVPADLAQHECLRFSGLATGDTWPLIGPEGRREIRIGGRFRADSSEAIREAVLAGMGLYLAPLWLFGPELRDGRVVRLLPGWRAPELPIQAIFPSRRQVPARVRAVIEHLATAFRADPLLGEAAGG